MTDVVGVPATPVLGLRADEADVPRRTELFRGLDAAAVDALLPHFTRRTLARDEAAFTEGEPGASLFVLVSGRLLLKRSTADQDVVLAVLGPGDLCGELSVFDPGPRTSTAVAAAPSVVAELARDPLLAWAATDRVIGERLMRVLARRLRRTNSTLTDLIFTDVAGRLAKVTLDLADRFGTESPDGVLVDHGLTQVQLAQAVGASRETVNKALSDFADRGWIRVDVRSLLVLDRDRLAQRART